MNRVARGVRKRVQKNISNNVRGCRMQGGHASVSTGAGSGCGCAGVWMWVVGERLGGQTGGSTGEEKSVWERKG